MGRHAAPHAEAGNVAGQRARAQHGNLPHWPSLPGVLLDELLELLLREEGLHHRACRLRLGDLAEGEAFFGQRTSTIEQGGAPHHLRRFDGRRLVLARLGLHLQQRDTEHGTHGVLAQWQGHALALLRRAPIDRARHGPREHGQCRVAQCCGRGHFVDDADAQGRRCALRLATGNPVDGDSRTGQARQAHRAAEAREEAELDLGHADQRVVGHDAQRRTQAHLQPAAKGQPVDGHHGGHRQVFEGIEGLVRAADAGHQVGHGLLEHAAEFGDVGADDEDLLGAGHEHAAHIPVGRNGRSNRPRGLAKFFDRAAVELVDGVALAVEDDLDDAVVQRPHMQRLSLEHARSCRCSNVKR